MRISHGTGTIISALRTKKKPDAADITPKGQPAEKSGNGICMAIDPRPDSLRKTIRVWEKLLPDAECRGFSSGEEAWPFFLSHSVDLVIMEISLGSLSALELAKEMIAVHPRTNICFLTDQTDYAGEAWRLHATDYVIKPLTEAKLKNTLTHLRFPSALDPAGIG